MAAGPGVYVDASDLLQGVKRLALGLRHSGDREAMQQATSVADDISGNVPVLTGALRDSVGTTNEDDGAGVTYGGDLPYAWKIERRDGTVEAALSGVDEAWKDRMVRTGYQEIRKL